ncbi:hypothetical protein [Lactococcus termiticola]|uniref:Uncharacterized protein n=1 Tax=Lactococcus termiticola TaxID=2169526 RepID=A0A2R5HDS2_9LACT|nr:hypothetical protein [Lactococcus termiticola]GBG95956.1 hypothetical protein NtB2_00058 [Lactococcus termiticola]
MYHSKHEKNNAQKKKSTENRKPSCVSRKKEDSIVRKCPENELPYLEIREKWLYASLTVVLFSGGVLPAFTPFLNTPIQKVKAATTPANGQLTAGGTADTGDHTYQASDITQTANWTLGGGFCVWSVIG